MFGKKASSPQRKAGRALPPGKFRMGGEHFKDDEAFIKTAVSTGLITRATKSDDPSTMMSVSGK